MERFKEAILFSIQVGFFIALAIFCVVGMAYALAYIIESGADLAVKILAGIAAVAVLGYGAFVCIQIARGEFFC